MKNLSFKFNFILPFLFLILPDFSFGQIHQDCISALAIGSEFTFQLDIDSIELTPNQDEVNVESCFHGEFIIERGLWYKLEVLNEGVLIFDIIPIENMDIDFILFASPDGSCDDLELIRCMTSGETIGLPYAANEPCIGPTGLAYGSEDITEEPGCNDESDNYLAPVEVEKGDILYLLDNDFVSGKNSNYLIRTGGTCELKN